MPAPAASGWRRSRSPSRSAPRSSPRPAATRNASFLRSLGVQHVFSSRTLDFADEILQATGRQGVDVVLNSLPGDAITKSLSILRAYGRFLEIGKTDIYQNRMIGLLPFQDNLSYFAIDLDRMLRQRPDNVRELFAEVMEHFERGDYRPLPLTEFPAEQTVEAFRYMAQRKNIGKVVVTIGDAAGGTRPETARIRNAGRGGEHAGARHRSRSSGRDLLDHRRAGRLGLQVAGWLAAQGARHLVLLSRRGRRRRCAAKLDELRGARRRVAVLHGDVADRQSLAAPWGRFPPTFRRCAA